MKISIWRGRAVWSALSLAAVLVSANLAYGQISFSLSSPDNLNNLTVGSTATFHVSLSGVTSGQELDSAAAVVLFDSSLLDVTSITAGAIVPNPLSNPLDFVSGSAPGLADATFFTLSPTTAHHLLADGVLFSFQAEVLGAGNGSVSFDFVDATEFTGSGPQGTLSAVASQPLNFISVVPEPSSVALALGSIAVLAWIFGVNAKRKLPNAKCG